MAKSIILLTAILIAMMVQVAYPCSCADVVTVATALEKSQAVFRGFVTSIEPDPSVPHFLRVTFRVTGYWKGPVKQTYSILTYESTAACGYGFLVGTEFLVYAYPSELGDPVTGHVLAIDPFFLPLRI